MKNSLLFVTWVLIMFFNTISIHSQTVLLSEDFSGFTTGTHTTPSTSDISLSLDARTSVPGWRGDLIYSAGGEVKIGTSSSTGWIETPVIDMTQYGGNCIISFDISRWSNDVTTVQVYLDNNAIGEVINPTDTFSRTEIHVSAGTSVSRVKIQALTKRFFIDNFMITAEIPTPVNVTDHNAGVRLWPVPSSGELFIENAGIYTDLEILDSAGRIKKSLKTRGIDLLKVDISCLECGIYIIYLRSDIKITTMKFIKL